MNGRETRPGLPADDYQVAAAFYDSLRQEVIGGNAALTRSENELLRAHYPIMMQASRYPASLARQIYSARRRHAVTAIRMASSPIVLDAGCGYGSESFLFAQLGARVIAVDISDEKIAIAKKRCAHFSTKGQSPKVEFAVADLDTYVPPTSDLSLTWMASVLPAIQDKSAYLRRIYSATRIGGKVLITDLNLANPLFALGEIRRGHFGDGSLSWVRPLLDRIGGRERDATRYPIAPDNHDGYSQFLHTKRVAKLLEASGLRVTAIDHAGFAPPQLLGPLSTKAERWIGNLPLLSRFALFYTVGADR